ncbi:MAG: hypothetical protein JOS17DRAFT_733584 [Linnemannia elongata]|nr:MAG: hypothetical protein JOS17DRAFT_733584 [Linnemannia elongata]
MPRSMVASCTIVPIYLHLYLHYYLYIISTHPRFSFSLSLLLYPLSFHSFILIDHCRPFKKKKKVPSFHSSPLFDSYERLKPACPQQTNETSTKLDRLSLLLLVRRKVVDTRSIKLQVSITS